MKKFLSICIEIEETVARTYRQLSLSGNLPTQLKIILENLATDEDAHAMQLRFGLRFSAGTDFTEKQTDGATVASLLIRAQAFYATSCQQEVDVKQALGLGIALEEEFCAIHICNSMSFSDPSLKRMFAALAEDDKVHLQKLLDAKQKFL